MFQSHANIMQTIFDNFGEANAEYHASQIEITPRSTLLDSHKRVNRHQLQYSKEYLTRLTQKSKLERTKNTD
jgi:hypothetical protein